jgi:hypothetical protein
MLYVAVRSVMIEFSTLQRHPRQVELWPLSATPRRHVVAD